MKIFLLIISLFLLLPNPGQQAVAAGNNSLAPAGLAAAGLIRIGDLLLLLDDWYLNTLDGYSWTASPNGSIPFLKQNWQLFLDGFKMNLATFDLTHLNMLGLAPNLVDSVTVLRFPQLYQGEFVESGLVQIHSRPIRPGLSLCGTFSAGNETGDPGPYFYTTFKTPNVDRLGKDGNLVLAFGRKAVSARAQITLQEHTFTDFAMRRRIHNSTVEGWGSMYRLAPAVNLILALGRSRHEMFFQQSRTWRYFYFLKPLGREIPTDLILTQAGIAGKVQILPHNQVHYRLQYASQDFNRRPNVFELDFARKQHSTSANLENQITHERFQAQIGLNLEHLQATCPEPLQINHLSRTKIYSALTYSLTKKIIQRLGTMAVLGSTNNRALKTSWLTNWRIHNRHQVQLNLSLAQSLPEENNSLWFWIEKGYRLLDRVGVPYQFVDSLKTCQQLALDLAWQIPVSEDIGAELSGSWRKLEKICLEQQPLDFNPQTCSFSGPVTVFPDAQGQIANLGFTFRQSLGRSFQHQLVYRYLKTLAGDPVFKQAWQSLPQHKVSYRLISYPFPQVAFWGMISYMSARHWPDYLPSNGATCDYRNIVKTEYFAGVPPVLTMDLQLQKHFWHRQVVANLLARNVRNADFRYHPVGASFDLSFFLRFDFAFHFSGARTPCD